MTHRQNLPFALFAGLFVVSASATRCTMSDGTNGPAAVPLDDGGAPIAVACSKDTDCGLPPSTCESPSQLGYYQDPRCVQGRCQWTHQSMGCPCSGNGCQGTTTSSSAPIGPFGGQGGQAGEQNTEQEAGESLDAPDDHQNPCRSDVNSLDCGNESCEGGACATGVAADP